MPAYQIEVKLKDFMIGFIVAHALNDTLETVGSARQPKELTNFYLSVGCCAAVLVMLHAIARGQAYKKQDSHKLKATLADYDKSCIKVTDRIETINTAIVSQFEAAKFLSYTPDEKAVIRQLLAAFREQTERLEDSPWVSKKSHKAITSFFVDKSRHDIEQEVSSLEQLAEELINSLAEPESQNHREVDTFKLTTK